MPQKFFLILAFCLILDLPLFASQQKPIYVLPKIVDWKAYSLSDEGNYVLRLRNSLDVPIRDLMNNLHVYIPSGAFIKQNTDDIQNVFIPSTGEYLVEVNLLKLLSEEGFNISLRSHSFVYVLHNKKLKQIANLEVYKLGPAKPYLSYAN